MKHSSVSINEAMTKIALNYQKDGKVDICGLTQEQFDLVVNLLDMMSMGEIKSGEPNQKELVDMAKGMYDTISRIAF